MSEQNKLDTQQQDDKILNILGFGDSNFVSNSAVSEASEKRKRALKIIVANGSVEAFLGKRLTYEDLDSLSPKQQKRYYELYTEKNNSMIASSLSDAFIDGITILVGKVINVGDMDSYRSDLKNDFLTSNGINHVVGMIATCIGQPLGLFSASIITAKHMVLNKGKDKLDIKPVEQEEGVHQQE